MQIALDYIKQNCGDYKPDVALILGSGLGCFADKIEGIRLNYSDIPGFPCSEVKGHSNRLVFCKIANKDVVIMQGRVHYYEGFSSEQVVYPVKLLKLLGVKTLVVTNAAGLINTDFGIGSFMLITDHINSMGVDFLRGKNDEFFGVRFPDMSEIYKKTLISQAEKAAKNIGLTVNKGVYCARSGPCFETPAEIAMLRTMGADAVGMSTVPEACFANYCGIDVLGISYLANYAAGITAEKLAHEDIIKTTNIIKNDFERFIVELLDYICK